MKKLATLVASFAVLWGSHAAAGEIFKGEEAIELIVEAHEEGLILGKRLFIRYPQFKNIAGSQTLSLHN